MTDWTEGYVADIGYTYGYYGELNPLRARFALLNAGLHCPTFETACDLGFGQGLSVNCHAAASSTRWFGTDFNPAQAGFAQELAAASGSGARLFDQTFAEFAERSDIPDFDYIGLHGIWSWVSDENRAVIVEFIRRKLKVGGVLYVSYNTWPGWTSFAPLRHLMVQHAQVMGSEGQGIVGRIDGALEFAEKLLASSPRFARANPTVAERLKKAKEHGRQYLAHEYFNRTWDPIHFAEMADWLAPAKVDYACSAHYLDHVDGLNLSAEQQAFLREIPHPVFRETVRDFLVDQQFRRDYWIKGPRRLSLLERAEALRAQKVVLTAHRPEVSLKVSGALRGAKVDEAICNPVLDVLADHGPKSLQQIEASVKDKGIVFPQLMQAVMALVGAGHLGVVQERADSAAAKSKSDRLNACLLDKARGSGDIGCLASPVTGGGIGVGRFDMLFLLALGQGKKQPEEWARSAWQVLRVQGQKLVKEGKALETAEENLAELQARAQAFATKYLPILQALQIV
jgi:SAM-dependent methyltransferase